MRSIILILLFLFPAGMLAQKVSLLPIKVNYKWGYINPQGSIVISPRYEFAGDFGDYDFAPVKVNSGMGLIDTAGREIIPPVFKRLEVVDSFCIKVKKDSLWSLVKLNGDPICPFRYLRIEKFRHPWYLISNQEKWGMLHESGYEVIPVNYDTLLHNSHNFFILKNKGFYGIATEEGKKITDCLYINFKVIHSNLVLLLENQYWKGIDRNGNVLFQGINQRAIPEKKGNFIVFRNFDYATLYNEKLKKIISDSTYQDFILNEEGFIYTLRNRKTGLIDESGKVICEPLYRSIIRENLIFKVQKEGKWGMMNKEGKILFPAVLDVIGKFRNNIAVIKNGSKWGLIHINGKIIHPCTADRVDLLKDQAEIYTDMEKTFLTFDKSGNVIDRIHYKKIKTLKIAERDQNLIDTSNRGFRNNRFAVNGIQEEYGWFQKNGKWGLQDDTGRLYIPPMLSEIEIFPELGLTLVSGNGIVDHEKRKFLLRPGAKEVFIDDFSKGLIARILLESGPALLTRNGQIISSLEVTENGKTKVLPIAYIGEFFEDKVRVNVGGDKKETRDPNRIGGTWGYVNRTGEYSVKAQFQYAYNFINGRAIVKLNGLYGVIDAEGKFIIPNKYDEISHVPNTNDSLFFLKMKRPKAGILSSEGKIIIEPKFDDIAEFSENFAAAREKKEWGFIDLKGDTLTDFKFTKAKNFSEGYAAVKTRTYWGYIDSTGNTIIPFQYSDVGNFNRGLALAKQKGKIGYIDKKGNTVIPFKYVKATDFHGNFAAAKTKRKFGIINREGKWIIRPGLNQVNFNPDHYTIVKKKRKYGMINPEGKYILKCKYKKILPFSESLAMFMNKNGLCGFIDSSGTVVIPPAFKSAESFSEGLALVYNGKKYGYINKSGTMVIDAVYKRGTSFTEGKAYITTEGGSGFIDTTGHLLIALSSFEPYYFSEGIALVGSKDFHYFLNKEGSNPFKDFYEKAFPFQYGMAIIKYKNRGYGVIDSTGSRIVDTRYDKIETFKGQYAKLVKDSFIGVADFNGNVIVPADFETIAYLPSLSFFKVEKGDNLGYFDIRGNWVWKPSK